MRLRTTVAVASLALGVALAGCQEAEDENTAAEKGVGKHEGECTGDCTKKGECAGNCDKPKAERGGSGEKAEGHDCTHGTESMELVADHIEKRTDSSGRNVLHAGQEFSDAKVATVADVVGKLANYVGKTVVLEGNVIAMCHHRRAWFAMVGNDKSGSQLRVLTRPVFLVPEGSISKSVRVEGTIDEIEVPVEALKHFAKEHKLDPPPEGATGKIKQPMLRATSADFYD